MAAKASTGWIGRHPLLATLLAIVLLTGTVGAAFGDDDAGQRRASDGSTSGDPAAGTESSQAQPEEQGDSGGPADTESTRERSGKRKARGTGRDGANPAPAAAPQQKPKQKPGPRTFLVTRIIDGDTLELGNGKTVRVVGIDTPEVGECGYDRAAARLGALVLGRQVRLTMSDEDRDHYGRLLRYVDAGPTDAGLRLISEGHAIARYDSRDGYGFHPREPRYVAADRGSRPLCPPNPRSSAAPAPAPAPAPGGGCAPGYAPCVPPSPPDVDCADVDGPITVTGSDPHGLDADGDGTACE